MGERNRKNIISCGFDRTVSDKNQRKGSDELCDTGANFINARMRSDCAHSDNLVVAAGPAGRVHTSHREWLQRRGGKPQIPTSKSQGNCNKQMFKKPARSVWALEFGISLEVGVWDLELYRGTGFLGAP